MRSASCVRRSPKRCHSPFAQMRPLRQRRELIAVRTARLTSANTITLQPQGMQQLEMRPHRRPFRVDVALEQAAAVPAGDEREAVRSQDRAQRRGLRGNLLPSSTPVVAGGARLASGRSRGGLAAERRQVVVAPGERIDADANVHGSFVRVRELAR